MMSLISKLLLVLLVLLAFERPTYAYLDPGSGSMLLQVLLGGAAAVGVIVKLYWQRLRRLFGLRSADDDR
jgi:hypothetical protein